MEIWKDVVGYEGMYQVSNLGRVKRLERTDTNRHTWKEKILKGRNRNGYEAIHISIGGEHKHLSIHRLVAEAFCEKPDGCDIVNHIDNNKHNNKAENLEWTTYKGNMQHASKQGRMRGNPISRAALIKANERKRVAVIATDKYGNDYYFESQAEAAKVLGVNRGHIAACCRKDYGYKRLLGYEFRYADNRQERNE